MKAEELPPEETGIRIANPQTCQFCGEVLRYINPCSEQVNASLCIRRQKR